MFQIREAREEDLCGIYAIFADAVRTSTAIWVDDPGTIEDRRAWWLLRRSQNYPVLVAVEGEDVLGRLAQRRGVNPRHGDGAFLAEELARDRRAGQAGMPAGGGACRRSRRGCGAASSIRGMDLLPESWAPVWALETPLAELALRALVLYFGIVLLLRVMPRRTGGELGTMDLVMILLVTEAATHSLGGYSTLGDGLFVIVTVMLIDYGVNALSYRWAWFERLFAAPPLPLVVDGKLQRRNMRREFLTEEELINNLHQQGVENLADVKAAYVEGNGKITVICRKDQGRKG